MIVDRALFKGDKIISTRKIEGKRIFQDEFPLFTFFLCHENGEFFIVEYLSGYPVSTGSNEDDVVIEAYTRLSKNSNDELKSIIKGIISA